MLSSNRFAFKEWAAVCAALADGRQTLVLRKGGIHERGGEFSVEHHEFWIYPTRFHQSPDELRDDARPLLEHLTQEAPAEGCIQLSLYAVVEEVFYLRDESLIPRLANLQVLSEPTLRDRFHYRAPGLFILPARIYRLPEPTVIPESPHFAGCRTWVDLERDLPTQSLQAVLADADFRRQATALRAALTSDAPREPAG